MQFIVTTLGVKTGRLLGSNIYNAPCKHYIPKKSRELLKEDSCRNLIQYLKRNKPNGKVECSISGLPGCIGAGQCKFYLKKNVHK